MKLTIARKLFITVMLVTACIVGLMIALTRYSIGEGFSTYLARAQLSHLEPVARYLENKYSENGSWDFALKYPGGMWSELPLSLRPPHDLHPPPPNGLHHAAPRLPPHMMDLLTRVAILDSNGRFVWGNPEAVLGRHFILLQTGGKTIGELRLAPEKTVVRAMEEDFVRDQDRNLWAIALAVTVAAAIAAFVFSRDLIAAIRTLVEGTRSLAAGQYGTRIVLNRSDELGELASEISLLGEKLDQQQQAQKQWIVDTSHELRTPIAILRAQIEALQDGVQMVTPKTLNVLHSEVMALGKLVSDLHQLARSDLGELRCSFVPVDLLSVLHDSLDSFKERFRERNIEIECPDLDARHFVITADSSRMRQLFSNLLENSLRYTKAGGKLRLSFEILDDDSIILRFDDSEPGVHESHLPRLFERFFRGEQSRSRSLGGTGLGLSICKTIVEAHTGTITAHPSPLKGLRIEIWLPAKRAIEARTADGEVTNERDS